MIDSPCVRSCCLDQDDVCLGCFRSLQEILQWGAATEQRQREIVEQASQRKAEHARLYDN